MIKKMIVNADDFGLTNSVSEGILSAYLNGIVTSTSVMMNTEYSKESIVKALHHKKLSLGVHLVFNKYKPVSDIKLVNSLVDENGMFLKNSKDIIEKFSLDEFELELENQILKFIKYSGKVPSHIDCHHWVILHQKFYPIYEKLAVKYKVNFRKIDSVLFNSDNENYSKLIGDTKHYIEDCVKIPTKLKSPVLLTSFFGHDLSVERLIEILEKTEEEYVELMVHPGFNDYRLKSESSYSIERELEHDILCDTELLNWISNNNIELVNNLKEV